MEVHASAFKHGVAEDDLRHAIGHALTWTDLELMTDAPCRTKTGRALTDQDIENLSDEATKTPYESIGLRKRGRPTLGEGPAELVSVRLDPALRAALDDRAAKDETTVSDVIRTALRRYIDAT